MPNHRFHVRRNWLNKLTLKHNIIHHFCSSILCVWRTLPPILYSNSLLGTWFTSEDRLFIKLNWIIELVSEVIKLIQLNLSDLDVLLLHTVPFDFSNCVQLHVGILPLHGVCCGSYLGALTVVSLRWDRTGGERGAVHGAEQGSWGQTYTHQK